MNILARREHSRAELARKLAPYGEADEVDALLDVLEQENLLSNVRYVEMLAHARSARHGSLRLKSDLREKGISEHEMAEALEGARMQDFEVARAVWLKKFGGMAPDAAGRARQYRFLATRGFPSEVIRRVLGGSDDD
jgi:regulatory protein